MASLVGSTAAAFGHCGNYGNRHDNYDHYDHYDNHDHDNYGQLITESTVVEN